MPLVTLIVVLIVIGVLLWLANSYIPMDPKIKMILNVVVTLAVVIWLLYAVLPGGGPRIGHFAALFVENKGFSV